MYDLNPRNDLLHGERLLIRTVRLLALTAPCHSLRASFEEACGYSGQQAYRMLEVFVQQLSLRGRWRLTLSIPVDPRLTDDETQVLDAFGCAQAEDYRSLDERLAGLVGGEAPVALGSAACMIAETFAMNGLFLRARPAPDAFIPKCWRDDVDALRMAAE